MTAPLTSRLRRAAGLAALAVLVSGTVALGACADAPAPPATESEAAEPASAEVSMAEAPDGEVPVPAAPGASAPRLALDADGVPTLSWTQPEGDDHVLRYAAWTGAGWSAAQTADAGADRFANGADTPGVTPLSSGRHLAHVPTRGASSHATDVQVRFAGADGWSEPALLNTDGVAAEHGFVSAVARAGGGAGVVWLDGRDQGHGHHGGPMTLRYAEFSADGARQSEARLDSRVCDCCPTAAVATPDGLVVAYRDRSPDEVRDIAVVRQVDGAWTDPVVPHPDGWRIDGCPVNGPALAARGDRVALAWFSDADSSIVRLSVSDDGGASWGAPVRIDDGAPMGQVGVAVLADGRVAVSWLEHAGDRAGVRVRALPLGAPAASASRAVATVPAGRASGIPRLVALGDRALVAWTDPAAGTVRTAVVRF